MTPELLQLADTTPGWLSTAEGIALHNYAKLCSGPYIEIGSYCGKSAIYLGAAARERGTYLLTIDNQTLPPKKREDVGGSTHTKLLQTIEQAGLRNVIFPLYGDSDQAYRWLAPSYYGFCFIDGDHEYPAVSLDFETWGRGLGVGGILAFHDSEEPGPARLLKESRIVEKWAQVDRVDSIRFLQLRA